MASAFVHTFECCCSAVKWAGKSFQNSKVSIFDLIVLAVVWVFFKDSCDIVKHSLSCSHWLFSFTFKRRTCIKHTKTEVQHFRFPELMPNHELLSIFYLSWIQTLSMTSSIRIAMVHWNRRCLSLLDPYQLYQSELPCDLSTQILSHGQRFLCPLPRYYKVSILKVNNLLCLLQ